MVVVHGCREGVRRFGEGSCEPLADVVPRVAFHIEDVGCLKEKNVQSRHCWHESTVGALARFGGRGAHDNQRVDCKKGENGLARISHGRARGQEEANALICEPDPENPGPPGEKWGLVGHRFARKLDPGHFLALTSGPRVLVVSRNSVGKGPSALGEGGYCTVEGAPSAPLRPAPERVVLQTAGVHEDSTTGELPRSIT